MEQTFAKEVQSCQMIYEKSETCKSNKHSSAEEHYSSYKPNVGIELPNYVNDNEQSPFYVNPIATSITMNQKISPNEFQWKICQDLMQYQTSDISLGSLMDKNYLIIGKQEDTPLNSNIMYSGNWIINQTNNIPVSIQNVSNSRNSDTDQSNNGFITNETKNVSMFDNCTQTSPINEMSKKKVKLKTEVLNKINNHYRTKRKSNCNYYETHKIEISQKRRVFYELNKDVIRLKRRTIYEARKDIYNMKRRDRYRKQKNNITRVQKSEASDLMNRSNQRQICTKVLQSETDESSFDTVFTQNNSNLDNVEEEDTANPLRPFKAYKSEDNENKRRKKEMNRLYYQKHKDMIKLRRRSSYEMKKDMYNMKRRDRYNKLKQKNMSFKTKENKTNEQMIDPSQFNGVDILDKQKLYYELHKSNVSLKRKDYYEPNKALIFEKAKTYYESQLKKLS